MATVRERCGPNGDCRVIKTSLDRPEIYIQVSPLQKAASTMLDLQWVLPLQVHSVYDIPKTIIFFDSIKLVSQACELLKVWMKQLSYPVSGAQLVAPFFSDMATGDKRRIATKFRLPSEDGRECFGHWSFTGDVPVGWVCYGTCICVSLNNINKTS